MKWKQKLFMPSQYFLKLTYIKIMAEFQFFYYLQAVFPILSLSSKLDFGWKRLQSFSELKQLYWNIWKSFKIMLWRWLFNFSNYGENCCWEYFCCGFDLAMEEVFHVFIPFFLYISLQITLLLFNFLLNWKSNIPNSNPAFHNFLKSLSKDVYTY